jgi:hypothetical protein
MMEHLSGVKPVHLTILRNLARVEECNYFLFRDETNPWRRESYFDGQVKWLVRKGFVLLTGLKTIQITDSGKELVHMEEHDTN